MRLSVIIASWNAGAVLGRCLESLARQEVRGGFETIVVDNASTDDTAEVLARHADHVQVITKDHNAGFSVANNEAADVARGEALFFLNSDTELLSPDVLERVAEAVEAPGVAMAGPMLLNPDGTLQPSCAAHPSIVRALLVATGLFRLLPDRLLAVFEPGHWSHDSAIDTGWVMGAAVAVRADLFRELGGFWPTLYAEEEDLAYRAQRRGLRVRFDPSAKVMHVGNFSLAQRLSDAERAATQAAADVLFLRTHYRRPYAAAIRALMGAGFAARVVAHTLLGHRERAAVFRSMARVYASPVRG